MNKRFMYTIAIAVAAMLLLIGCGSDSGQSSKSDPTYCKITYNDGSTETLEVYEIPSLVHENVTAYNNKYAGFKVEVVDEIISIGNEYGHAGFIPIDTRHGWNAYLPKDMKVIVDLRTGSLVKIVGYTQTNSWSLGVESVELIE